MVVLRRRVDELESGSRIRIVACDDLSVANAAMERELWFGLPFSCCKSLEFRTIRWVLKPSQKYLKF
jgi:hypothetical protein